MKKRIIAAILAVVAFIMFAGQAEVVLAENTVNTVNEGKEGTLSLQKITRAKDLDSLTAGYSIENFYVEATDKNWYRYNFSFDVPKDSFVYLDGSFSGSPWDGLQAHVDIYKDKGRTNPAGKYGWGYWESPKQFAGFLDAGTYYCSLSLRHANFRYFDGNVNVMGAYLPSKKLLDVTVKKNSKKRTASVVVKDRMSEWTNGVYYAKGRVTDQGSSGNLRWNLLRAKDGSGGAYVFEADSNGIYTLRVKDRLGRSFDRRVKIKGLKK